MLPHVHSVHGDLDGGGGNPLRKVKLALVVTSIGISITGCMSREDPVNPSKSPTHSYRAFSDAQAVSIKGAAGDAMEPFISRDGVFLLFNTSNVAPHIASLQFATHKSTQTFASQGDIRGVNESRALSGTPTMDRDRNLYFVSPRTYSRTLSTIYTGRFTSGKVTGVHLVPGISPRTPGVVDFDVEVSSDGSTLYVSVGHFDGGTAPTSSSLAIFEKAGNRFVPDRGSADILHAVNVPGELTYAASISANGLELFFTRANPAGGGGVPAVYRAVRGRLGQPFGQVEPVAAITGFAEAPSISADGTTLYYHHLVGSHFEVTEVTRPRSETP